jgi:hypothetical protein
MDENNSPIYIVFSPDSATEFDLEMLNQLTQEFGRSLEAHPDYIGSLSFAGRDELPKETKSPELIFAQQLIIQLAPIVTPWILDKVDQFVKSAQSRLGSRITARVQIGTREVQVTPQTSPAEMIKIKHQVKTIEKMAPTKRYALVIGNAEYLDEDLASLASPTLDAQRLAQALSDPQIGAFDDVETLMDADNDLIKTSIERFFSNRQKDDLLLMYFSGHGLRNEAGQLFLAARNIKRNLLRSTGVAANFIKEIMDSSFSQRQILILDCCFGGAMVEGSKSTKEIIGEPVQSALAFQNSGFGRIIITASESMQYAFDGQSVQGHIENSLFTKHLIEGLHSGKADVDKDGLIGIDELYQYAYRNVVPLQTPSISTTSQTGQIFIALNPNSTIQPGQLSPKLMGAIHSDDPLYRLGAVSELASILKTGDPSMAIAAESRLRNLLLDDSRKVSEAAKKTLDEHHGNSGNNKSGSPIVKDPIPQPPPDPQVVIVSQPAYETGGGSPITQPVSPPGPVVQPAPISTRKPSPVKQDLPAVAKKWSWGAFWLTFIWGIKHKAPVTFLFLVPFPLPLPQILVGFYCGAKGRRWAWQNLEWENEEQFAKVQGNWGFFGFVLGWLVWITVIGISMSIFMGW